ncbi:hypothetical protein [Sinosporangium siamense]|uniref:WD40 repeat domain-containing protein n=1 Tax=Sinosporangium siamense TaxID=1367973 RepID=A0A919V8Z5_9ACTN|nr:hypothetical protein [Sinosporangium siamense]GII96645.1 hypothetical protein Ssi02_68760 [Sinosporangium siamense]
MTWLRNALDDLAGEAPRVDLAERTIRTHERRRRRMLSVLAPVPIAAVALAVTATVRLLPAQPPPAAESGAVRDLPASGVGPLSHAYMTFCRPEKGKPPAGCVDGGWRVVTHGGATYRVAQALRGSTFGLRETPFAIAGDGRKIAYYDAKAGTFAVRDLASGTVLTAPTKVPKAWLGSIAHLLLSDDGRFLAFSKMPRLKDPAMLFDLREGMVRPLPNGWNPIGLSPGGDTITLAQYAPKTRFQTISHLWQTSTASNEKTIDVTGTYLPGALRPDGETAVAVKSGKTPGSVCPRTSPDLVHLDPQTGKVLRRVPFQGLSTKGNVVYLRSWTGPQEITAIVSPIACKEADVNAASVQSSYAPFTAYAVNVKTGKARKLTTYSAQSPFYLVLPGFPATL